MEESMNVTGFPVSGNTPAPKRKRIGAAIIDLVVVPILLGVVLGIVLYPVPEIARNIILAAFNILWLVVIRDFLGVAPGRWMVGIKLANLSGGKASLLQSLIRNVFLFTPIVLFGGTLCEFARVFVGPLLWRRIFYGLVLVLTCLGLPPAFTSGNVLIIIGVLAACATPILFFILDKPGLPGGNRLMDLYAQTQIIQN